ncbi:hypothetical protein BGZ57DRAFT_1010152 [Hyaloscypha finlandica]|nr:hypothetical protein BGZ57DRAFT_1010152 [Hyaloscypha finlandica]
MASYEAPKKTSKLRIFLFILAGTTLFSAMVLMIFLATDVLTIPYLTPVAHFLGIILSPFVPLLAPLMLGAFLKVQRVCTDVRGLWSWTGEEGALEICGLNECKGSWVEVGLLVLVVLGQWRGWRWDMGLVDKWVEGIVAQNINAEEAKKQKAMGADVERGLVDSDVKEVVAKEDFVGSDMEKTALLADVEVNGVEKA